MKMIKNKLLELFKQGSVGEIITALTSVVVIVMMMIVFGAFQLAKSVAPAHPFLSIAIKGNNYSLEPATYCSIRLEHCFHSSHKYSLLVSPDDLIIISIPEEITRNPWTMLNQFHESQFNQQGVDKAPTISFHQPGPSRVETYVVEKNKFLVAFELHLPSVIYSAQGLLSRAYWGVNFVLR